MAGGPFGDVATCMTCAGPSDRTSEGLETDWYLCRDCGATFGLCFDEGAGGGGPPTKPLYPPSAEEAARIKKFGALRKKSGGS